MALEKTVKWHHSLIFPAFLVRQQEKKHLKKLKRNFIIWRLFNSNDQLHTTTEIFAPLDSEKI